MYTADQVKRWVREHWDDLVDDFLSIERIPAFLKNPQIKMFEIWSVGRWLHLKLKEEGATDQEIRIIEMCYGQRSFYGSPYEWAVEYLNKFIENKEVKDKPGLELAHHICKETLGI